MTFEMPPKSESVYEHVHCNQATGILCYYNHVLQLLYTLNCLQGPYYIGGKLLGT